MGDEEEQERLKSLRCRLQKESATITDENQDDDQFIMQVTSDATEGNRKLIPAKMVDPPGGDQNGTTSLRMATYQLMPSSGSQEEQASANGKRSGRGVTFSDHVVELETKPTSTTIDPTVRIKKGIQRSATSRMSLRKERENREKFRKLQRLASMPGDSELEAYMDGLAQDPQRFFRAQNADTDETILHLFAKEGKVEILKSFVEDDRLGNDIVNGLLHPDKLAWTPVMAATKADQGAKEIVEMFIKLLDEKMPSYEHCKRLMTDTNKSNDTLFTLLMRNGLEAKAFKDFANARKMLFALLFKHSVDPLHSWFNILVRQLLQQNSCDLTSRSMKELIDLATENGLDFAQVLLEQDDNGNNILMELAKNMKDDALREILTNTSTSNDVTHSILITKNKASQTLLTLIEVNRESLSESLPVVLKREFGCHRKDLARTELCLSEQLETSGSAYEIIQELHQLEPKGFCQIFNIWFVLFLTSLTPNIGLAFSDIFSDAYLTLDYYGKMINSTYVQDQLDQCQNLTNVTSPTLEAYAACLNAESKFAYTIVFLILPLVFYLTEFLTLRTEYEPTGLRKALAKMWRKLHQASTFGKQLGILIKLIGLLFATFVALVLWQPVTAICKFYRDGQFETSSGGNDKVLKRQRKRYTDLAASRGELIEVNIEAVFEPMVQGYIIFPSIIDIIYRLASSVQAPKDSDGTWSINFELSGLETAQIFSITVSMFSLAWCYSEYNSVRKNMLLDVTVSPCSRFVMFMYMLLQIMARLLAFMLFTLYWGPGNFYPLIIFVSIHMLLAALIHVVFSEDLAFWKQGNYLKFFHNVMMNSLASIYFHNYLRYDEMPRRKSNKSTDTEFIDSQLPGLHVSTFLRQLLFDILYSLEFVILLGFGSALHVEELNWATVLTIIISVSIIALILRLVYYMSLHIWSNVIITGKKLIRKEFDKKPEDINDSEAANVSKRWFKYVFISRNTWILGSLKHIEVTLLILPKRIIDHIKGLGKDLEHNFIDANKNSPLSSWRKRKISHFIISLLCFPFVILVILINVVVILILVLILVLAIPLALIIYIYNWRSGFKIIDPEDEQAVQDTHQVPPDLDCEEALFQRYPELTLANFESDLKTNGEINLSKKVQVTAEELERFALVLLWMKRKSYPLKSLNLDNCDINDDKLESLRTLIVKFDKVSLNGSQKITSDGWASLAEAINAPGTRLRHIELKISKTDENTIKVRKEILLDEFKDSMTGDSLRQIAKFLPRLEKVYLDDAFNDHIFAEMKLNVTGSKDKESLIDAWKALTRSILTTPILDLKLKCLSLSGCSVSDDILRFLAPALLRIKHVHLGRNPITSKGWEDFKRTLEETDSLIHLTHLDLSIGSTGHAKMIRPQDMKYLTEIIIKMEEVNLSGQQEIGAEGWMTFIDLTNGHQDIKLKTLNLDRCKVKPETRDILSQAWSKFAKADRLYFGHESFDENDTSKLAQTSSFFKKYCC